MGRDRYIVYSFGWVDTLNIADNIFHNVQYSYIHKVVEIIYNISVRI